MSIKVQMLPVAAEMQKELHEIDVKFNFLSKYFINCCGYRVKHYCSNNEILKSKLEIV